MAAILAAVVPPVSTPRQTSSTAAQISAASCSTQPSCGNICRNSFCRTRIGEPDASKSSALVLVVP